MASELATKGRRPYVIPVGGTAPLGTWGYLQAVEAARKRSGSGWVWGLNIYGIHTCMCIYTYYMYIYIYIIREADHVRGSLF